jgi:hypothetical protein
MHTTSRLQARDSRGGVVTAAAVASRRCAAWCALVAGLVAVAAPRPAFAAQVAPMQVARSGHTATLLADGTVLVAGGGNFDGVSATAEIYDPSTNTWTMVGSMAQPRVGHVATRLADGRVLVAGSDDYVWDGTPSKTTGASAEIFDPVTRQWSPLAHSPYGGVPQAGVALADGRIWFIGRWFDGFDSPVSSSIVFDPARNAWGRPMPAGDLRQYPNVAVLTNGSVLARGGQNIHWYLLDTAETFDPGTGPTGAVDAPPTTRAGGTLTATRSGDALAIGGYDRYASAGVERYRAEGHWETLAPLRVARDGHSATEFGDGRWLVMGGEIFDGDWDSYWELSIASVEVVDPLAGAVGLPLPDLDVPRFGHTATLLADGRVLVAGGKLVAVGDIPAIHDGSDAPGKNHYILALRAARGLRSDAPINEVTASVEIYQPPQ